MSKNSRLPTGKGTDLFPTVIQLPCKLVIYDGQKEDKFGVRSALAYRYSGYIKNFHAKCQQLYAMSSNEILRQLGQFPGAKAEYVNIQGDEYINVYVDPEVVKEELEKIPEGPPDFCVIDIVARDSATLEGRFVARDARFTPFNEAYPAKPYGEAIEGIEETPYDGHVLDYSHFFEEPLIEFSEPESAEHTIAINKWVGSLLVDMRDLPVTGVVEIELYGLAYPGDDDIEKLDPTYEVLGYTTEYPNSVAPNGWLQPTYQYFPNVNPLWPDYNGFLPDREPATEAWRAPPVKVLEYTRVRYYGNGLPDVINAVINGNEYDISQAEAIIAPYEAAARAETIYDIIRVQDDIPTYIYDVGYLDGEDTFADYEHIAEYFGFDELKAYVSLLYLPGTPEEPTPPNATFYHGLGYDTAFITERFVYVAEYQYAVWDVVNETTGEDVDWDFDLTHKFYWPGARFAEATTTGHSNSSIWTLEKKPTEVPSRSKFGELEVPGYYEDYFVDNSHPNPQANTGWKHLGDVKIFREFAAIAFKPAEE